MEGEIMNEYHFLPPRTKLFHLEPIGIGTPFVESLTSYVCRLAAEHCVTPQTLIEEIILPEISTFGTVGNGGKKHIRLIHLINGVGKYAYKWCRALNRLTGRNDMHLLTFIPWEKMLNLQCSIRSRKFWCPICISEDIENSQTLYERLIWQIAENDICPIHQMKLQKLCPNCKKTILVLGSRMNTCHCPFCNSLLIKYNERETDYIPSDFEEWKSKMICEMIAQNPNSTCCFDENNNSIFTFSPIYFLSRIPNSFLSIPFRTNKSEISLWKRGKIRCKIKKYIEGCYYMHISPFSPNQQQNAIVYYKEKNYGLTVDEQIFIDKYYTDIDQVKNTILRKILHIPINSINFSRIYSFFSVRREVIQNSYPDIDDIIGSMIRNIFEKKNKEIEIFLLNIINSGNFLSVKCIANKFQVSSKYISNHFRYEYLVLSSESKKDRHQLKEKKINSNINAIPKIINVLLESGKPITYRNIRAAFPYPSSYRSPKINSEIKNQIELVINGLSH